MKTLLLQIIIGLHLHVADNMEMTGTAVAVHVEDGYSYALVKYDFDTTRYGAYALAVEEQDATKIVHYGVLLTKNAAWDIFTTDEIYVKRKEYIQALKNQNPR